jgi:hypothetical protein
MSHRVLIISPVRNEAPHIENVVRSVAAQELPPARWIVIDDASTDDTLEILRRLEAEVPFLQVVEAPRAEQGPVADRLARAAAPRNFNAGLAHADWGEYTHVMKLDGDIELPPDYFNELMARFEADPSLGLAAGILVEPQPDGTMRPIEIARIHVHGALKCWSRECFEAIGGVQERLGWDTIDETYARMRGFRTSCRSIAARWAAPTARSAATRVTASAPTSRTSRRRGSRCAPARSPRASRTACPASPSSTGTPARPHAASSACPTANTAGSRSASCAGAC